MDSLIEQLTIIDLAPSDPIKIFFLRACLPPQFHEVLTWSKYTNMSYQQLCEAVLQEEVELNNTRKGNASVFFTRGNTQSTNGGSSQLSPFGFSLHFIRKNCRETGHTAARCPKLINYSNSNN